MNPIKFLLIALRVWLSERHRKPAPPNEREAVKNAYRERRIRGMAPTDDEGDRETPDDDVPF